jgi:hypothetical protein
MKGTANASTAGRFCGRAVHGVSGLSREDLHQIEAHRAKDRPTPWAHLAARFAVNELDLRQLFEAKNDNQLAPAEPPPPPTLASMLRPMWEAGVSVKQISIVLKIDERSVCRMRERIGLPPRRRGHQ